VHCPVHLVRDFNNALLRNPFDNELRALAQAFGALMRGIVETIDQRGLKRKYMNKHVGQVNWFYAEFASAPLVSEAAEGFRNRLVRYRQKLFAFLEHDGVPWNNNNAEHAVKYFARYRRRFNGQVTENGLGDYLILLSLYVTCELRGIRFLDFLLSAQRDIDTYADSLLRE